MKPDDMRETAALVKEYAEKTNDVDSVTPRDKPFHQYGLKNRRKA